MRRIRAGIGLMVVGVCALTAVSAGGSAQEDPVEVPFVDCESRIQVVPSRDHPGRIDPQVRKRSVTAGRVMFLGARQWGEYPDETRPGIKIPVKVPMIVDAGSQVTIALNEESAERARIMVGRDQKPYNVREAAITLEPCPPDATVANRRVGHRTPFLGGFKFHGPTCVALTVTQAGGKRIAREISFGAPCGEA